jgi:hypothetical protein
MNTTQVNTIKAVVLNASDLLLQVCCVRGEGVGLPGVSRYLSDNPPIEKMAKGETA